MGCIGPDPNAKITSLIRRKLQGVFTSILVDGGSVIRAIDFDYCQKLGVPIENLREGENNIFFFFF